MKNKFTLFFLLVLFTLSFNQKAFATICSSIVSGNWNSTSTWSCGAVPGCGDTIYINHKVTVTVTADYRACTTPLQIVVTGTGTLHFSDGKKLRLPCNSGVELESGGQLTTDSYNGNSEELEMGGGASGCVVETLWQSSDGSLTGPLVLGTGLPIELLSFDVYRNEGHVDVIWKTATETNNDYFTIERSANASDFEPIAIIDGAGNSNSIIEYLEKDYSPLNSDSYYRLKQTDYDGHYSYSHIVHLKNYETLSSEMSLYPNPTDGVFHLVLNGFGDEEYLVVVRDISGKESYSKVVVTSTDRHIEAIDLTGQLAAGTYIVTASSRNELYSQKLIVK